jgi:hypothetical protein
MEQKDYLLREIEKIGMVLRAILNTFLGKKENMAITMERSFEKTKEMLINEMNFDLDKFLSIDKTASLDYLSQYKGMNPENLELLAEITYNLGITKQDKRDIFFTKALQLYELCNEKDRTFSVERNNRIKEILSRKPEAGSPKLEA